MSSNSRMIAGVTIGLIVGVLIGAILDSVAAGVAVGVGLGATLGLFWSRPSRQTDERASELKRKHGESES